MLSSREIHRSEQEFVASRKKEILILKVERAVRSGLLKRPSTEEYRKVMGPFWNYSIHSIIYLREYDVGLEAASYLLNLTEQYKKELAEKEWQENRYMLWYFYLNLLDKSDCWEDFVQTIQELKKDPNICLLWDKVHITEHLYWKHRHAIVQRKIQRQEEGESVQHLRHRQLDELDKEEYYRRIGVLKYWFQYGQVAEKNLKDIFAARKKNEHSSSE